MGIYCAARSTIHLCQLTKYADILMQSDGTMPSLSKKFSPSSTKSDCQRDRPCDQARSCSGGRNNIAYETVAQVDSPLSADRKKSTERRTQHAA